jgi:hypothetical protein
MPVVVPTIRYSGMPLSPASWHFVWPFGAKQRIEMEFKWANARIMPMSCTMCDRPIDHGVDPPRYARKTNSFPINQISTMNVTIVTTLWKRSYPMLAKKPTRSWQLGHLEAV